MAAFVSAFIKRERRDRWMHLFSSRPKQLFKNSHKLHEHLDKSCCTESPEPTLIDPATVGMFFEFHADYPPLLVTGQRAIELGTGHDAVFSIVPGKLAAYFFHEGFVMECRA
ncbi:hypothetical protein [Rubripirellula obstinata]|nr:hypothetical protein [Rubripirellula obstinata]